MRAQDTGWIEAPTEPAPEAASRRSTTLVLAGAVLALLALVAVVVPVPYAIQRPGPTVDTLGTREGEPLIVVDGAPTYPTSGQLRLTTVSVSGGPGYPVTAADVLLGWLSNREVVLPVEALFPAGSTREQLDAESSAEMTSSQTSATVAALEELGYDVPMVLTVESVAESSGAAGVVRPGDVITAIEPDGAGRTAVDTFADLTAVLARTAPETPVVLTVTREGRTEELGVTTTADPRTPTGSILGLLLVPDVELPVEVEFDIEDIGGPSAGTMFALGIVDLLTPGEMTGGEVIAGTGTMGLDGEVGAIGGIRQKLLGAERDGATWFLAPAANCAEVVGYVPEGLDVVAVATIAEARDAVEAIGSGQTGQLPGCTG